MNLKGYDPKLNYCSSSPDVIFGVIINKGCFIHDRHYRNERKVRMTRLGVDRLLRDCIYAELYTSDDNFQIRSPRIFKLKKYILVDTDNKLLISMRKKLAFPVSRVYYYACRATGWRWWVS